MWTRRQAGVPECSMVFCHVVGQIFALAILVLWVTSALANPITLRIVSASPGYTLGHRTITVRVDDDGARALEQFTSEHVGEDIEIIGDGRVLTKTQLQSTLSGGIIIVDDNFDSDDEVVSLAGRLAADGKLKVRALGRSRSAEGREHGSVAHSRAYLQRDEAILCAVVQAKL